MNRPIVVGLGQVSIEFLGVVPRLPEQDADVELREISVQVGGGAAIAVGTAAAMGCRTRLASKTADDFLAGFMRNALTEVGIDVRASVVERSQLSGLRVSLVSREPARHLAFHTPGDVGELVPDEVDITGLLDGASAVLVDGAYPRAQVALAEAAQKRGIPVVFDGSQLREGIGALVRLCDVLICSERLASELAPRDELKDSLLEIRDLGPRAAIITLGAAGSVGLHGSTLVEQAAFPIDVVDSSRAGAVYHGAFVAALVGELPFAQCMEFASAAAALSCTALGGWAGIPDRSEVVDFIRKSHKAAGVAL